MTPQSVAVLSPQTAGPLRAVSETFAGGAEKASSRPPRPVSEPSERLSRASAGVVIDAELAAYVRRLVAVLDRQTGRTRADNAQELEDAVQDVFVQLLEAQANGVLVERKRAFVDVVVRGVMRNVGSMRIGSSDRQAIIHHAAWRRDFVARERREPSWSETDRAAERIREEWPDRRHRPTSGFHKWVRGALEAPTSLDAMTADDDGSERRRLPEALSTGFDTQHARLERHRAAALEQVQWAELAEACAVQGGLFSDGTRREARVLLFAALAQGAGVPVPRIGVLGRLQVQLVRQQVRQAGGVAAVIREFGRGELSEAVEALFAPWTHQSLSHHDRQEIIAVLQRRGGEPDELWDSAVRFASREKQPVINRVVSAWLCQPAVGSVEAAVPTPAVTLDSAVASGNRAVAS